MAKKNGGAKAPPADVFAKMADAARAKVSRAPTQEQSSKLTKIGTELATLEDRIMRGEALLKTLKERRMEIMQKDLVDAMDEIGQDVMGLPDQDVDIKVITHYHASLPALPDEDKKPEEYKLALRKRRNGLKWLRKNGHDGLIRNELTLTFPRGHDQRATQILAELQDRAAEYAATHDGEVPYGAELRESVNWNSLTKLVKDLTESGQTKLPLADLGASIIRMAVIEKRGERKKSAKK